MPQRKLAELQVEKRRAAGASLLFNLLSTAFKLVAAVLTGSVALLSEAVHSTTDVVASSIAFVSVRAAAVPPDEEHPYGHGKIESLAGFGESVLLLMIVVYIVVESIKKLISGAGVDRLGFGMIVMGASALGSVLVGLYVAAVGQKTSSLALQSNGQHLRVDAVTSVGVLIALAVTAITGLKQADAIVALLLAAWIGFSAWLLAKQAFDQLIDRRLPDNEVELIRAIVAKHDGILGCHRLRSRLSGSERYIDMHIVVPNQLTVVEAHELADRLEKHIAEALEPAQVVIHVDPYDESKEQRRNME
ncbi:MAG TPA: cation diffusion facilitator family transporter [Fimbriimonadaceae bacterium]|nr:cation diffusion facilitator family transporter [Fimbriimonadaceae bacterium]